MVAGDTVFMLPGPVKMDPRVLQAMAAPAMNHRGSEFKEILAELRGLVQYMFGTTGEVAIVSGSGTAGLGPGSPSEWPQPSQKRSPG